MFYRSAFLLVPALLFQSLMCRAQETTGPTANPAAETLPTINLSLKQAVDIALSPEGNARIQIAEELIRQAKARSAQVRAALLPNIDASVSQQSMTRNLAAVRSWSTTRSGTCWTSRLAA